jgi:hypothetical protein
VEGKAKVQRVLEHSLWLAEKYDMAEIVPGKEHFAIVHNFKFVDVQIEGVD